MSNHVELMRQALEAAKEGIEAGQSPFGAVIATKDGEVVFTACNRVRANCDPTAHAEIMAIRGACTKLRTINLAGHVIATTCEPCPMCAAAIHWARLDAVVYGAGIADAKRADFNELSIPTETLYEQGASRVRVYPHVLREECTELFELWKRGPNPNPY
ncbi:MAG: nucleoside deaminase [Phycisphaerae bacterium]